MKRRDARPVRGVRNMEKGRMGLTRFRRANRNNQKELMMIDDPIQCPHDNGWINVDDDQHDVLERDCADGCGERQVIRQANTRWDRR